MRKFLPLLLACLFINACVNENRTPSLLNPSRLPSQYFSVSPDKDTILYTSHGSRLKIAKGSFPETVDIEIKEAFTPQEILMAGMTTTAGDKPLRSAGMLYFNASANGENLEPLIPIATTIPTASIDTAMRLFKGEYNEDSSVNWTEPTILDTMPSKISQEMIEHANAFFQAYCRSCHSLFNDGTGPALKNFTQRGPWKNPLNVVAFINNPPAFMDKDQYTQDLSEKFGTMMTAFPELRLEDIMAITAYINTATVDEPRPSSVYSWTDSTNSEGTKFIQDTVPCGFDTTYTSQNYDFPEYDTAMPETVIPFPENDGIRASKFTSSYLDMTSQGYDFKITANGWYNIDAYLKSEGAETSEITLFAEPEGDQSISLRVYYFIPYDRVLQDLNYQDNNRFSFSEDGKINSPTGERAVIFAIGSKGESIFYGISEFTTRKEQVIKFTLTETSADKLENILKSKNINGVDLTAIKNERNIYPVFCDSSGRRSGASVTVTISNLEYMSPQ